MYRKNNYSGADSMGKILTAFLSFISIFCFLSEAIAEKNIVKVDSATFNDLAGKVHRFNLGRTGVWNTKGLKTTPKVKWKFKTEGPVRSSAVVVDDVVYIGSYDHYFYAINAQDGSLKWKFKTENNVSGSAAVVDNVVYFASESGGMYAVNASDGSMIWKQHLQPRHGGTAGSPAVMYDTVFIGAGFRGGSQILGMMGWPIFGLNSKSGKKIWKCPGGPQGYAAICTDGKNIYAGSNGSYYTAIDIATAKKLWVQSAGHQNRQFMSMTYENGLVYMPGTMRGTVMCRKPNAKGRKSVWLNATLEGQLDTELNQEGKFGYEILTDLAVTPTTVYTGCNDGKLHTFDAKTGKRGWTFKTDGKVQSSPSVADNTVYFGSWDGHLYALNADSGKLLWKHKLGHRIISSPWPGNGTVYVGCDDGYIYALH